MSHAPLELRAGPVRLQLEGADLRALRLDAGPPAVQRVYPAFRDAGWGTAPIVVRDRRVKQNQRGFTVVLGGTACLGELELRWAARARGGVDGTVSYALEAEASRPFECRRLGLCVHLDAALCAGGRAVANGGAGEEARPLDDEIAPQPLDGERYLPMLGPFTELAVSLADGGSVALRTGETPFELEDQRNWGDGSLKAYSSGPAGPLRLARGGRVRQEVRLDLTAARRLARGPRRRAPLTVGSPGAAPVAGVGLGVGPGRSVPAGLKPAHLRVDVALGDAELADERRLLKLLADSGAAVELAVHGTPEDPPALPAVCAELPLARVLALDRRQLSTPIELARLVAEALGRECPLAVGTAAHFSEVCRRPPSGDADLLCWSTHPQVHAIDERSVIENLPALAAQVRTARMLRPDLRPVISELRIGPAGAADPRAGTAFGAAWAVGALAQLHGERVDALTLAGEAGHDAVLGVAAVAMAARGAPLRPVEGGDPDVAALAWGEGEIGMLLANLRPAERGVAAVLPSKGPVRISPLGFGAVAEGETGPGGRVDLRLGPYGTVGLTAPG